MYNKNLPGRATLTPKFEDGVKTFIEWAKGQRGHMDGDKIRCPCRKCKNTNFRTPDEDYFEAATVPPVSEERTLVVHVEGASLPEGETHTGRSHCMLSLEEPRNVRLGLCTDGFALHDQCGHTCSCWPVIIIPYNLPPGVRTYDHATDKAFMVWAALMWTVNDLPAYAMVSG
ncbi:hypothetical protein Sango_2728500 [Sesamum angolense]|uniref:Transposase-associated domain-containing protein n=1 Tax=Sesamum angolense TaxID=2727404 RepID=A0AAE1VWQ4_9LAMI|nr:hypothetical protein Sango_2728500 [Sesamum angolense]